MLEVPLILFLTIVAPIWIIAHYVTRWRMAKSLSPEDEKQFGDLWQVAERMEERIHTIERILDAEAPAEERTRGPRVQEAGPAGSSSSSHSRRGPHVQEAGR